jgi:hypothetical protein
VQWPPSAAVKIDGQTLIFGNRRARHFQDVGNEGVAICGPQMKPDTGIYEIELLVSEEPFSMDGFFRADIGVVMDASNSHREGSGVRWEAGDGDVYIGNDFGEALGSAAGWQGGEEAVEEGALPRWDNVGTVVGLLVDTTQRRLLFTRDSVLLPLELALPPGVALNFVVSWDGTAGGAFSIVKLRNWVNEPRGPSDEFAAEVAGTVVTQYQGRAVKTSSSKGGVILAGTVPRSQPAQIPPRARQIAELARRLRNPNERLSGPEDDGRVPRRQPNALSRPCCLQGLVQILCGCCR